MFRFCLGIFLFIYAGCISPKIQVPHNPNNLTGEDFYKQVWQMPWKQRDSVAVSAILKGNIPSFSKKLIPIHIRNYDSTTDSWLTATVWVMPDYLSVGTNDNWARIPLTPIAAQIIADSLHCFLPTRKLVDDIYTAAKVKLEPVPMYIYRDSSVTMWQLHLIIEGQRKNRKGLIAGIKKDVVISDMLTRSAKNNRVAIYGWHKLDGKPIQPLYAGHVNWYVDYSHGIRLVYEYILVNGKRMHYTDVMKDSSFRKLITDENFADVFRY
ncbi:MAG: hypothetical protein K2X37_11870 [Chitinophagaceae bacterium]|nr:hypothetical protein [Chitinophagaceae bacterium]